MKEYINKPRKEENCCCLIDEIDERSLHCEHCSRKPSCECDTCKELFNN